MSVGFIGIGLMGEPMARNLLRAGTSLVVWNRTGAKCARLGTEGAEVARDVSDVFACASIVIVMLIDEASIDTVLARGTPAFAQRVAGHTIVHMGTTSPAYSRALEAEIRAAGGSYAEAPVSGSRGPAERAELVIMLAGDPATIALVQPILAPMGRAIVPCGAVPNALAMKLAINLYMIAMIAGLAEATHFAHASGLPLDTFASILGEGQMSSVLSRAKTEKLVARDFAAQAAIDDVAKNTRLIGAAARDAHVASPVLDACHALFEETSALGFGTLDMTAVIHAIEARTDSFAARASASSRATIAAADSARASGNA